MKYRGLLLHANAESGVKVGEWNLPTSGDYHFHSPTICGKRTVLHSQAARKLLTNHFHFRLHLRARGPSRLRLSKAWACQRGEFYRIKDLVLRESVAGNGAKPGDNEDDIMWLIAGEDESGASCDFVCGKRSMGCAADVMARGQSPQKFAGLIHRLHQPCQPPFVSDCSVGSPAASSDTSLRRCWYHDDTCPRSPTTTANCGANITGTSSVRRICACSLENRWKVRRLGRRVAAGDSGLSDTEIAAQNQREQEIQSHARADALREVDLSWYKVTTIMDPHSEHSDQRETSILQGSSGTITFGTALEMDRRPEAVKQALAEVATGMRRAEEVRTFYYNEATGQQQKQQPASFVSGDEETDFQSGIVGSSGGDSGLPNSGRRRCTSCLHAGILLFLLLLLSEDLFENVTAHNWLGTPSRSGQFASTMRPCSGRTRYDINAQVGPDQITAVKWSTGHKGAFYIAIVPGWEAWRLSTE